MRHVLALLLSVLMTSAASAAGRVALVIGQDAYPGGKSATIGLPALDNSRNDVAMVAALLRKHGFDVLSCDGKRPGCFDLDRPRLEKALGELKAKAAGADTALVYFAGHGMASPEGNILTPIDARVDCASGSVTNGVPVEAFMAATEPARHKLVLLDACRNNPLGEVCPGLKGRKLSFTRIEAGAMQGLLLVTSTQFGQEALDGPKGANSPFAAALVATLEANPGIYFEQVMNEVGRATYETAQKTEGFQQIPGKVVGTPAPADCLAGRSCVGDTRMAALAQENEKLTADASAVRNLVADEERARGKPYLPEERQAAVERIGRSLTSLAGSAEPKVKEASRLFSSGKVAEGRAKLDEALDDDEKAASEIERLAKERRRTLARNARDAARLALGTELAKALVYFERATRNDPEDAQTWLEYASGAVPAGRLDVAKKAFEQAAARAKDKDAAHIRYWAMLGLGDVASDQGQTASARRFYDTAAAIAAPFVTAQSPHVSWQRDLSVAFIRIGNLLVNQGKLPEALSSYRESMAIRTKLVSSQPGNGGWQHDLAVTQERIGEVLLAQGDKAAALASFRDSKETMERLARSNPGNAAWQRDLSVGLNKVGAALVDQANLPEALKTFRESLAIAERLAKADPGNGEWQRDLAVVQGLVGDVLSLQGNLPEALKTLRDSSSITERLAKSDPGNSSWQRDLSVSYNKVGAVLMAQGKLPEALQSFRAGLTIIERLSRDDAGNALWRADLAASNGKLGQVYVAMGDKQQALRYFKAGREVVAPFAAKSGHQLWIGYLKSFDANIAALGAQ
jgi:tetratricopeptide (TPR) repeat protein